MRTAKEVYAKRLVEIEEFDDIFQLANYQPMLEEFGHIILQICDKDCQGDSRILYQQNNRFGWLQFGWGSCSGCDALKGCKNIDDVQLLMNHLYRSIKWFDTKKEALKFFMGHDWEGDYSSSSKEQKDFVQQALVILGVKDFTEAVERYWNKEEGPCDGCIKLHYNVPCYDCVHYNEDLEAPKYFDDKGD